MLGGDVAHRVDKWACRSSAAGVRPMTFRRSGCTPWKEATGSLDDGQSRTLDERLGCLQELDVTSSTPVTETGSIDPDYARSPPPTWAQRSGTVTPRLVGHGR
jgi:hypothetical protein